MSTRNPDNHRRPLTVAIDGPAASGKSTTARLVARRLGYLHIDSGAMYRAVTLKVLRMGVDPSDAEGVGAIAASTHVELVPGEPYARVLLDGEDVSESIRQQEVTAAVSAVSLVGPVRQALVHEQRAMGRHGGVVMDGRDIGTVVFPDADLKIFMVAGITERALRRQRELRAAGSEVALETLARDIEERDRKDEARALSPLRRADDAVLVDTSVLSIDEQVAFVVRKAEEMLATRAAKA
jgi:cytidylate kinase